MARIYSATASIARRAWDGSRNRKRLSGIRSAVLALLLSAALTACESTRSFERTADGSTVYIDELSQPQKAQAREAVAETLVRGLHVFDLQIGDELEIFFHVKHQPTAREYVISVADRLRIDTLNETAANRELQVEVRPDGRI